METVRVSHKEKRAIVATLLLSFFLITLLILPLIGSFITHNKNQLTSAKIKFASMMDFWNSQYDYYLGSLTFFGKKQNNFNESIKYFSKALKLNPYHLYSWFSLAKAYWMSGDKEKALRIFDRLAEVNNMNRNIAWDAGIFLLTKGENSRALKHLGRYLFLEPQKYENIFNICFEAGISPQMIKEYLLDEEPVFLDLYYTFLIERKMIDVLDRTLDISLLDKSRQKVKLRICNNLIANGYIQRAQDVWAAISNQEVVGGITNGGFEDEMTYGCFSWIQYNMSGYKAIIDERIKHTGNRSIAISFDGSNNVRGPLLSQIIPVKSEKEYDITVYVKTKNITTSNGVYIVVNGYKCDMVRSGSENMRGTGDWQEIHVPFRVPEGCEAVMVSIRRDRSYKLNNKISGTIWFDDISVEELN